MNGILRIIFLIVSLNLFCTYAVAAVAQSKADNKQASSAEPAAVQARSVHQDSTQKSSESESRGMSDSAWVALLSAFVAALAYKLNRSVAYRTVTIEAQKLLVEINKQYISDPTLLVIEGEYKGHVKMDLDFDAKLRAMAYLKLNVFEIIFAALPRGRALKAWKAYFEDSLKKSHLLGDELEKHREIYQRDLIRAYDKWKKKQTTPVNPPPKHSSRKLFRRRRKGHT